MKAKMTNNFYKHRKRCGRRNGEIELLGLIILIIGLVTVCVLMLPPKLWIILIGLVMVALGYRLFIS